MHEVVTVVKVKNVSAKMVDEMQKNQWWIFQKNENRTIEFIVMRRSKTKLKMNENSKIKVLETHPDFDGHRRRNYITRISMGNVSMTTSSLSIHCKDMWCMHASITHTSQNKIVHIVKKPNKRNDKLGLVNRWGGSLVTISNLA